MPQRSILKIGIMGGSFDPIHLGHLIIAERITEELALDTMLFIPCNIPPHKIAREVAPGRHRLRMVELALKGNPRFRASDMEIARGRVSYSVDTVRGIKEKYGLRADIYFIIGADSLIELPTWREYKKLLSLCTVVTAARPGCNLGAWPVRKGMFTKSEIAKIIDSFTRTPLIEISSTEIRNRCREGRSIRYLVPDAVARYIAAQKLYVPQARGK